MAFKTKDISTVSVLSLAGWSWDILEGEGKRKTFVYEEPTCALTHEVEITYQGVQSLQTLTLRGYVDHVEKRQARVEPIDAFNEIRRVKMRIERECSEASHNNEQPGK